MTRETPSSKELNKRSEELARKIKLRKLASHAAARGNSKKDEKKAKSLFKKGGVRRHKAR